MYICLCLGVTTSTVQQAIDAGARSTKQVAEACGAGSVCGRCGHTIRTMIEAAAPDPPSSKPDRLRRRWGRGHVHDRTQLPRPPSCAPAPEPRAPLTPFGPSKTPPPARPSNLTTPRQGRAFMIVNTLRQIAPGTVHDHDVPPEGAVREQRRSRVIAMTEEERDAFLGEQRTCRLATLGPGGPHVSPVWFVWDGGALWVYSLTRSQRWTDLQRDPRVAAVVDGGEHYHELHGVEIEGEAAVVGPVPRTADEDPQTPELTEPERLMAAKYQHPGGGMIHDGRHAWLRITPAKITSWDFRKLASLPGRS